MNGLLERTEKIIVKWSDTVNESVKKVLAVILFAFSPFVADLSFLILVGALGYFMNEKKRIIYYVVFSFVLTLICTINSSYYTFYTSFASISLISTTKFIFAVGDAVTENVVKYSISNIFCCTSYSLYNIF